MDMFKTVGAQWVWLGQETEPLNQYVDFRHEFVLDTLEDLKETDGMLHISIDTEYAVWLNGVFVGFNQYDDYPNHKSYDVLDVRKLLVCGNNALCILGYHQGQGSYQYMKGRAGLIYALKVGKAGIASGSGTMCRQSLEYTSGAVEKVSPQLSFAFRYDGTNQDGWLGSDFAMTDAWAVACVHESMADAVALYERPIKKLLLGDVAHGAITAQGFFCRKEPAGGSLSGPKPTTAEKMQSDYLSARLSEEVFGKGCGQNPVLPHGGLQINAVPMGNDGIYLLVDMQREEAGLFTLDVDSEDGVAIDVAYGEQLDDLRVRASVGGRNFAFTYICREGRQVFTHYFKRIAGRYVQLHIHGIKRGITLYHAGIRPVSYPLERRGSFTCGDRLFNKIYDVSVRTLELCMHEHYEDTPWREQALYAMDSRNQALCGYYCFGEYDFAESAFSLFAENLGEDGMMEICAPARDRITIPSFSMAWILAIHDLVLYSGRIETAQRLLPTVTRMLDTYIGMMEKGLMKSPTGARYWNFYEWADGLDDSLVFTDPSARNPDRLDAPLNLFFCMALQAGAKIAEWAGDHDNEARYNKCHTELKRAFHQQFWDETNKVYQTYAGKSCDGHFAELTQALALCAGAVPAAQAETVRERLAHKDNGLVRTTLSYAIYKYEALLQEPDRYASIVFEDIATDWGYMLYNGATSFWETIKGADDFDKAGSLCHGWSAIPVYFFYAYILGVKPLEPGFMKYTEAPIRNIVSRACGQIPTPSGEVEIAF